MPHSRDIIFQVRNLSNLLRHHIDRETACLHLDDNITHSNGWILGYLAHHENEDVFQKDLENAFFVRRSTVSKVIRLMESKGLIARVSVPEDARLKKLILTPEGRKIHNTMNKCLGETEQRLRRDVTDEELEVFFKVMEKFKHNIQ